MPDAATCITSSIARALALTERRILRTRPAIGSIAIPSAPRFSDRRDPTTAPPSAPRFPLVVKEETSPEGEPRASLREAPGFAPDRSLPSSWATSTAPRRRADACPAEDSPANTEMGVLRACKSRHPEWGRLAIAESLRYTHRIGIALAQTFVAAGHGPDLLQADAGLFSFHVSVSTSPEATTPSKEPLWWATPSCATKRKTVRG